MYENIEGEDVIQTCRRQRRQRHPVRLVQTQVGRIREPTFEMAQQGFRRFGGV